MATQAPKGVVRTPATVSSRSWATGKIYSAPRGAMCGWISSATSVTSGGIFLMCSRDPTPISPTASTGSSLTPQVPPSPPSYFHTSILKIQMQRSNGTAFHSTKDSPLEYRTNQRHVFSRRPSGATLPMLYDMVWLLRWNIIS